MILKVIDSKNNTYGFENLRIFLKSYDINFYFFFIRSLMINFGKTNSYYDYHIIKVS